MGNNPKISIAVTVYNLEQCIERCINSILNQKMDFDYQIVVGDDCSTDNSRDILLKLKDEYPDKIKLIFNSHNLGMQDNWFNIFEQCETKYIAIMDVDDYWIDPLKLQKQVDYLDTHPTFSMCATAAEQRFEFSNQKPNLFRASTKKKSYEVEDILQNNFIVVSSVVLVRQYLNKPTDYKRYPWNDWPLWVELAKRGPIGYMKDVTTVYNIRDTNIYSTLDEVDKALSSLNARKIMLEYIEPEYRKYCYHSIFNYYLRLMHIYLEKKNTPKVREYAVKALQFIKHYQHGKTWQKIRLMYYRFYTPFIHRLIYSPLKVLKILKQNIDKTSIERSAK